MTIEEKIKHYIDNFYETEDLVQITKPMGTSFVDDILSNDVQYISLCNRVLDLLNNSALKDKYRIEIGESCTYLIDKLFKAYVDENTFIVTSSHDHEATTSRLGNNPVYRVNIFDTQDSKKSIKVFQDIINQFETSKCTKIFCIMVGTAPHATVTIDQNFFKALKTVFIRNNIPHMMVLDDCQGIFMIERNYDVFDAFLATGHVLSCLFPDFGILFTKLDKKLGYMNKQMLSDLYNKLQLIDKYKDKANQFNGLMTEYFKSFINDTEFKPYTQEANHQFALALPQTINNPKYDSKFIKYGIEFNPIDCKDNFVRLRYHEVIIQDADTFIKGLTELKTHLNKLLRFKEMNNDRLNYSLQNRETKNDLTSALVLNRKVQGLLNMNQQKLIQERFFSLYTKMKMR